MFAFGHLGLTWGAAVLLEEASRRLPVSGPQPGPAAVRPAGIAVDYRFVILGSLLPDLIDKPLGMLILSDELASGRAFAHTLLFPLLLAAAALARRANAGAALAALAFGAAMHLLLDRMWSDTATLFWPLLGWLPERQDLADWPQEMFTLLYSDPYTYISEGVGALLAAALLASLLVRHRFGELVRHGSMGWARQGLASPAYTPGRSARSIWSEASGRRRDNLSSGQSAGRERARRTITREG